MISNRNWKTPVCFSILLLNGGVVLATAEDGVDVVRAPLELEVLAKLLTHGSLDSLEDVDKHTKAGGVVLVIVTTLEDTSADKASVPAVHVTTDDVGGGVVTNHVDVLGELLLTVDLLHPAGHDLVGVLVGSQLGLTVDDTLKVNTGEGLVHGLETDTEGTLGHTGEGVLAGAQQITLGEVDGDTLADGVLGDGTETAVLGLQKVDDDLHVGSVVARVGEDHDGVDVDLGEVARARGGTLLISEDAEGSDRGVPSDDVVGDNNVLEAVLFSDLTALVAFTTNDEDSAVVLGKSSHGGVRLDELVDGNGVAENLGELLAARNLTLTGTVGKENVRDLDAELVVTVEDLKGTLTLGDQAVTVDENTIDVESKGHVLGRLDLLAGKILDLRCQNIASGLDWGHTRTARLGIRVMD
jgi:hypothetical protein